MNENKIEKFNRTEVREREFAQRWSVHFNSGLAYTEAGYKAANVNVARVMGHRLLMRPNVKKYLREIWNQRKREYSEYKQMLIEDAIGRLTVPITEVAEFGQNINEDGITSTSYVQFKNSKEIAPEVMKYVEHIKQNREGFELRLTSRDKAIETLAKLTGAFEPEKIELGFGPIKVFPTSDDGNGRKQLEE